jgi:hypothetical protein
LTEFRKQVEDAEDPENEVEEEYHPKNQADFAWKCLRSLSHSHLDLFEFMEKTDEEKAGSVKTALQKLKDKENGRELKNVRPVKKSSGSSSSSSSSSASSSSSSSSSASAAASTSTSSTSTSSTNLVGGLDSCRRHNRLDEQCKPERRPNALEA